ncbi:MAG: hypothetical protein A3C11_00045 [Candidatus Sungbacteria bacterium RIFCSPHIGHO2_02_FULL_49_12]|uniref:Nucleotidyl transferase AbiEii/AbiGii toxin family protein n=1 Tax=Candidatus Sungbacteria bacterium RIFCSPHIGHO2_02_FULL_49_12 TaxID=1802271 RepID=A0A1G2KUD6_9BACT|nr:MAG: hypothetical protein A3C11_00045 [Candidatus Sungbacteria bacterium RIFCSPHIGHO2_02_FULL_49_12]
MEQDILTENQRAVIREVAAAPELRGFYLSGGTALAAYYLKHRLSDDLDFFSAENPDPIFLRAFAETVKSSVGATAVRFQRLYERNQFFFMLPGDELKVEFTRYPFSQLEKLSEHDGIKIDSLRDIAANKLAALLDRFDPKDFVDLYFLLQKFDLTHIRTDTEKKFGALIDPLFLGGELAKARRIAALPKMILPLAIAELQKFYADLAQTLTPSIFSD